MINDELYFIGIRPHCATARRSRKKLSMPLSKLRPDAAETHLALAMHRYWGYLDYDKAPARTNARPERAAE